MKVLHDFRIFRFTFGQTLLWRLPHRMEKEENAMPIYDYRCDECGKPYDVYHKVKEVAEDIVCPSCGSARHTRLISAPSFSMGGKQSEVPSCSDGSCCGGACSLN